MGKIGNIGKDEKARAILGYYNCFWDLAEYLSSSSGLSEDDEFDDILSKILFLRFFGYSDKVRLSDVNQAFCEMQNHFIDKSE